MRSYVAGEVARHMKLRGTMLTATPPAAADP
jgi:hypothetical protein